MSLLILYLLQISVVPSRIVLCLLSANCFNSGFISSIANFSSIKSYELILVSSDVSFTTVMQCDSSRFFSVQVIFLPSGWKNILKTNIDICLNPPDAKVSMFDISQNKQFLSISISSN